MTEDECQEIFDQLREYVAAARLQWVLDQVDETIFSGKLIDVNIRESRKNPGTAYEVVAEAGDNSKTSGSFTLQREEYSGAERLEMLLGALEMAVVRVGDLESKTLGLLLPDDDNAGVKFVGERRGDIEFDISQTYVTSMAENRILLSQTLVNLRNRIYAD